MKQKHIISKLYIHKYTELPHTYKFNQTWKELKVWPDDISVIEGLIWQTYQQTGKQETQPKHRQILKE
jgi:hypothetical protein